MRFIHTADLHLGKVLNGERLTDLQSKVLDDLLALVDETGAEAVVIAGDIYDRSVPPEEAVELFDSFVSRLVSEKGKKLLYIAGNHDSDARINYGAKIMSSGGVYIRGDLQKEPEPVVLHDEYGPVYFSLIPYVTPERVRSVWGEENLSFEEAMDFVAGKEYEAIKAAASEGAALRAVAVAHAFVTGGSISGSERELSVGGSGEVKAESFAQYTYTALGHLHGPQRMGERIRYSGSPLKYSLNEYAQRKAFLIVDIDGAGAVSVTEREIVPARDLRLLENISFQEVIEGAEAETAARREDFLWLKLSDREPVLGAMERLRERYPNILSLEWVNRGTVGEDRVDDGRQLMSQSKEKLFESFFEEVTGEKLSDEERDILRKEINRAEGGRD
ncbi:MAG: exonuclease SbcCD subunit D [Selenomonadaceae bacterium]|nr:exonuclease SbcCD subunit D [Selenomonadaceae bacterium]